MKQNNHIVRIENVDYKLCSKCKRLKRLKSGFAVNKSKSGRISYDDVCRRCRSDKNVERYNRSQERQKIRMPNEGGISEQACEKCKFIFDCSYRVKVLKSIDSPYCFVDSRYHFIFVREYGKE